MKFWKYQGAGNDFVMVDQREHRYLTREDQSRIERLCARRFGIGADGLILLQPCPGYDFEMIYFNADGRESTMCGNGGRCLAAFAHHLGISNDFCHFLAIDGPHEARISQPGADPRALWIELKMSDISRVEQEGRVFILNTGSPHYVRFEPDVQSLDMVREGRAVRYSDRFKKEGINVNLVRETPSELEIRTYERGVEDETLACGTGVRAAAIAHHIHGGGWSGRAEIQVKAMGGQMSVRFQAHPNGTFTDVWLCGPADMVFEGHIQ